MSRSKLMIGLLAAALGLVLASPALASPPVASVGYSDLDLSSPAGLAVLNARIRRAAESLCAGIRVGPGYWAILDARQCVRAATASAAPQVAQAVANANGPRFASRERVRVSGR